VTENCAELFGIQEAESFDSLTESPMAAAWQGNYLRRAVLPRHARHKRSFRL